MSYPLVFRSSSNALQAMTSSEFENFATVVLNHFASTDGPGSIYTPANVVANATIIGTFYDTYLTGNVGESTYPAFSSDDVLYDVVYTLENQIYTDSSYEADYDGSIFSRAYTSTAATPTGYTSAFAPSYDTDIPTNYNTSTDYTSASPTTFDAASSFTNTFTAAADYTASFTGSAIYQGVGAVEIEYEGVYTGTANPIAYYTAFPPAFYTGTAGSFDSLYAGPSTTYTGNYDSTISYTGTTNSYFTGTLTYTGTAITSYVGEFTRYYTSDVFSTNLYTADYTSTYISASPDLYTSDVKYSTSYAITSTYLRSSNQYENVYSGELPYTLVDTIEYTTTFSQTNNYTGTIDADYTGSFTGIYNTSVEVEYGLDVNYTIDTTVYTLDQSNTYTLDTTAAYTLATSTVYTGDVSYTLDSTAVYTLATSSEYTVSTYYESQANDADFVGPAFVYYIGPNPYTSSFAGSVVYTLDSANEYTTATSAFFTGGLPYTLDSTIEYTGGTSSVYTGTTAIEYTLSDLYAGIVYYTGTVSSNYTVVTEPVYSGPFPVIYTQILDYDTAYSTNYTGIFTGPPTDFTASYTLGTVGDVVVNTFNLYQDLTTPTGENPPQVIYYNNDAYPLRTVINQLADDILHYGVMNNGPGSYVLSDTSPIDGDVWVNVGTLTENYNYNTTTSKNLYKKIAVGLLPDIERPLKVTSSGVLQRLNDTEIARIAKAVRQRIVDTGVGQYVLANTAPEVGTWLNTGSLQDTLANVAPAVYMLTYTSDYHGTYIAAKLYESGALYTQDNYTGDPYTLQVIYAGSPTNVQYSDATTSYAGPTSYTRELIYTETTYYNNPEVYTTESFQTAYLGDTLQDLSGNTATYAAFTGVDPSSFTEASYSEVAVVYDSPSNYDGGTFSAMTYTGGTYGAVGLYSDTITTYTLELGEFVSTTAYTGGNVYTSTITPYTEDVLYSGISTVNYESLPDYSGETYVSQPSYTQEFVATVYLGTAAYETPADLYLAEDTGYTQDYSAIINLYNNPSSYLVSSINYNVNYDGDPLYTSVFTDTTSVYNLDSVYNSGILDDYAGIAPYTADTYTGDYDATPYTGPLESNYQGPEQFFTGAPATFTSFFNAGYFTGIYVSPAVQYFNDYYQAPEFASYYTSISTDYAGPVSYEDNSKIYQGADKYTGAQTFISTYDGNTYGVGLYIGPTGGSTPYDTEYTQTYQGETAYSGSYTEEVFGGPYIATYAATFGIDPSYTTEFSATYDAAYNSPYDTSYASSVSYTLDTQYDINYSATEAYTSDVTSTTYTGPLQNFTSPTHFIDDATYSGPALEYNLEYTDGPVINTNIDVRDEFILWRRVA